MTFNFLTRFSLLTSRRNLTMKILYAIQGTGNGHISRAREIVPLFFAFIGVVTIKTVRIE